MTDEQTAKILTLLQAEYPNSFSRLDDRGMDLKLELWTREFAEDDFNLVYSAVRLLMKTGRSFAPNIGEIRDRMTQLTSPENSMTEQEAWALVSRACSNGLYGYREEFEKLPPEIQQAVGAPEQLKEWAALDAETVQSVVASNFMRGFRATRQRAKEEALIPPEIRQRLSGIVGAADSGRKEMEKPERAQLMPAKLEPILKAPEARDAKPRKAPDAYRPMEQAEFEKRREEAIRRLTAK